MSEAPLRAKLCLGVCNDSDLRDLQMQRSDLEIVCALHNWRIVGAYEMSEHITAKQPSQQLQAMLKAARKDEFDILVTWGLDQICWMEKSSFSRILLTLQELKVQFYSYKEPFLDTSGPFAAFLMPLFIWSAKRESVSNRRVQGLRT